MAVTTISRDVWVRRGLALALVTIAYNVVEGVVAVSFGWSEESLSLFGFGLDAFVEMGAAAIVLSRLSSELLGGAGLSRLAEKRASRTIGLLLSVLAVGVAIGAVVQLWTGAHPDQTLAGVIIASLSASLMGFLWYAKRRVAGALDSATLRADAACTLACLQLSIVLLIGSAIHEWAPALWWADAVAALALALLIGREGWHTVRASFQAEAVGCGCGHAS